MKYNFDEVFDRKNTNSTKWEFNDMLTEVPEALPMWVADMDFRVPAEIIDALIKRARHGIFGYSTPDEDFYEAIINWMEKHHGWKVEKDWLAVTPGVVPAINWVIRAFTHPGDKVILQNPVYYPFFRAIKNNGCEIVHNQLHLENGKYTMNLEDLEKKFDGRTKLLILCSPHNPVGRVWTEEELKALGNLCLDHNVLVVSDEIHSDLVYKEYKHTPFASISDEFAQHSIICTSPSKTFNLAGLQTSIITIANPILRNEFLNMLEDNGMMSPNIFGIVALKASYTYGAEWLDELLNYLKENLEFLIRFLEERLPSIKIIKPQGTYLVWLDFRSLGMTPQELSNFLLKKAKIALDDGFIFGQGGEGFERMNIACPRSTLEEGLIRIEKAIKVRNEWDE